MDGGWVVSVAVATGPTYDDLTGVPQDDGLPVTLGAGDTLTCPIAPGLRIAVAELLR